MISRSAVHVLALTVAGVVGLTVGPVSAQDRQFLTTQSELFINVTVIDGRGGAPRLRSAVLVWGGRIQGVGSRGQMTIPQGTTVVDLDGAFMVPGFIDAHASPRTPDDLRAMLAAGITGVREGAMSREVFEERGRGSFADEPSPLVYIGGPLLDGAGAVIGVPLDSEEAAIEEVGNQINGDAAFVSLSPSVPADWIVAIARAARRQDTPLWIDRSDGWLLSLRAGADVASRLISGDPDMLPEGERDAYQAAVASGAVRTYAPWLERIDPEGPEVERAVSALLSRDATVVPLLASAEAPFGCATRDAECEAVSEAERAALRSAWPKAAALVRALHREGVRLLVGSDAPATTAWGAGFHREMQLLVDAGIPALEVLSMATRNAAIALGQLHERGTLEPGKRADFLILDGDPVADIRNARRISLLAIGGRPWRLDRDGRWERVRFD